MVSKVEKLNKQKFWHKRELNAKAQGYKIVDKELFEHSYWGDIITALIFIYLSAIIFTFIGAYIGYQAGYSYGLETAAKGCEVLTKVVGGI